MPGAFGYPNYSTARKTPSSEAVGMALMQRGQMQGGGAGMMPMDHEPMAMAPDQMAPALTGSVGGDSLREDGARRMTGAGQIDDAGHEDDGVHSANALNVAVGEALTRMGSGYTTNANPFKDRAEHIRQLQQLGLSEVEAQLLARTGGV